MNRALYLFVLGTILTLFWSPEFGPAQSARPALQQQKEIAVTVDDLPLNGPRNDIEQLRAMTRKLLDGIKRHKIPTVGFVNESQLYVPGEVDARIDLLRQWSKAGVELGNHTFGHVGFKDTPLLQYQDDFVRGDVVTKAIMKETGGKPRYFRHPFLQMGPTLELEKSFESFIAERGYKIAPVTVDTMDWMARVAYSKASSAGDTAVMKRVSDDYLKIVNEQLEFSEQVANELFQRPIKHVLLMHANDLNADNLDAVMKVVKQRGYRFITLEEALSDPVYQYPEKYMPTSHWLSLWAFSKNLKFTWPNVPEYIRKAWEETQIIKLPSK
jgi:peptidoglycan/xylan/chitin deacetylase (PgdA/CDA1 family)